MKCGFYNDSVVNWWSLIKNYGFSPEGVLMAEIAQLGER